MVLSTLVLALEDWLAVAAIAGPTTVAVLAVYLTYHYQLKAMRIERLIRTFSDVIIAVESAHEAAIRVERLSALWDKVMSPDLPSPDEISNVYKECDSTLTELGLHPKHHASQGPQSSLPWSSLFRPTLDYVGDSHDRAKQLFQEKCEQITRAQWAVWMCGGPIEASRSIQTLKNHLNEAIEAKGRGMRISEIPWEVAVLRNKFRAAAGGEVPLTGRWQEPWEAEPAGDVANPSNSRHTDTVH